MVSSMSLKVDLQAQFLGLDSQSTNTIKRHLTNYIGEKSFSGALKWLVFRIINAIRSIFNASAWQECRKILSKHIFTQVFPNSMERKEIEKCANVIAERFFLKPAFEGNALSPIQALVMNGLSTVNGFVSEKIEAIIKENVQKSTLKACIEAVTEETSKDKDSLSDEGLRVAMVRGSLKGAGLAMQSGIGEEALLNLFSVLYREFLKRPADELMMYNFLQIPITQEQITTLQEFVKELEQGKMNPTLASDKIHQWLVPDHLQQDVTIGMIEAVRQSIPQLAAGECPDAVKVLIKKYNTEISQAIVAAKTAQAFKSYLPKELQFIADIPSLGKHADKLNAFKVRIVNPTPPTWAKNVTLTELVDGIVDDLPYQLFQQNLIPPQFHQVASEQRFKGIKECVKSIARWKFPGVYNLATVLPFEELTRIGKLFIDISERKPISLKESVPEFPEHVRKEIILNHPYALLALYSQFKFLTRLNIRIQE